MTKSFAPAASPSPDRPLSSAQEEQVAAGVLINHGPRTPEQLARDKENRQEFQGKVQGTWEGIKTWFGNLF